MVKKAIVLVSGGLDSTTVLAIAKASGYECYALSINYQQRHVVELEAAEQIARILGAKEYNTVSISLGNIGGSALTDKTIAVPDHTATAAIPITYVPARNTIFLSIALAWAEVVGATDIFIGTSAIDYSGYPDCRPEFIAAFEQLASLATKVGIEGQRIKIQTPLITLSKAETIKKGISLGIDYSLTLSCYRASDTGLACGSCDSCMLRKKGFAEAAVADPTRYY